MKAIVQQYFQNEQEFYSMVLPFEEIDKISDVLIYGDHDYGYQRRLDKKHYQGIQKSLTDNKGTLPTSIIVGVNKDDFSKYLKVELVEGVGEILIFDSENVEIEQDEKPKTIFRIVDGQHRIAGLKQASIENEKFRKFPLNVIVVVTNEEERVKEVVFFRDINSKAKKLKMDLTLLAMYNYELLMKKKLVDENDIVKHLLIRIAHHINKSDGVWTEAIQFDIHSKNLTGVIGVAAFINSIHSFVKKYVSENYINISRFDANDQGVAIKELDEISQDIADILIEAWKIVEGKWTQCFENKEFTLSGHPRYKKDYYIQKTTGVNAIHQILTENIDFKLKGIEDQLNAFSEIIDKSPLSVSQWKSGGILSGLTSKSGFAKAQRIIEIGFEKFQKEIEEKNS